MATINSAKCYGLTHLGAIAPGYQADLLVVDNLEKMTIQDVYYKGRKIDQDGEIIVKEWSIRTEKYSSCWRILKGRLAAGISGWYIQCSRNAGR